MNGTRSIEHWLERGLLLSLGALLLLGPLATGGVRPLDFALIELLAAFGMTIWLALLWANRSQRLFLPPVIWIVLLFLLYAGVTYFLAPLEYVARQETLRWLVRGCIFLMTLKVGERQESSRRLVFALLVLGVLIAAYGIFQFATESDRVWHFIRPPQYAGRASGTYICPNHFAGFLGMLLPLALSHLLMAKVSLVQRILLGYAALVLAAGIAVSLSRGAWLAAAVTLVVVGGALVMQRHRRWAGIVFLLLLLAGAWGFTRASSEAQNRLGKKELDTPQHGMRARVFIWQSAVRMWRDHPWLGGGPGHFDHRFPAYRHPEIHHRPGWVHNDYLNLLADYGLLGGGLAVAGLLLLIVGGAASWRYVRPASRSLGGGYSDRSALLLGSAGGLVFAAAHAVVDFNMQIPANAAVAVFLAGTLAVQLRHATRRHWWRTGLGMRLAGLVLAGGAAVLLTFQAGLAIRHAWHLDEARRWRLDWERRVQALEAAAALEPTDFATRYYLGEVYRLTSSQGYSGWQEQAEQAITWYRQAGKLNPFDPYIPLRIGMCLDWLGLHEEAGPYFEEAVRLDPNNYYILAVRGWHAVQKGDWAEAEHWLERSRSIRWWDNTIAYRYLGIIRSRAPSR